MPRKDKKTKKPKKPKVQLKVQTIRPPKLKPCTDCGYKTGSAFTIPFGFADRLGTRRLETPIAPVVNINLGDYLRPPVAPVLKADMSIQTDKLPAKVKKATSDFEMTNIYKKKPEDIFVNPYDIYNEPFLNVSKLPTAIATPFENPSPFVSMPTSDLEEGIKVKGRGPVIKAPKPKPTLPLEPAAVYEGNSPLEMPRYRRSNVEIYTELLILDGESPNNAIGIANSYPKGQLKEKIAQLKTSLGKQKKKV